MTIQNYKIFINQTAIHLSKSQQPLKPEMEYVRFAKLKNQAIRFLNNPYPQDLELPSYNPKKLMLLIEKKMPKIEAAGGIVVKDNLILCILRRHLWDLPKGKIEKNETISSAALREVEEETGIKKLSITKQLNTSYHLYKENRKWILKKTYWFMMQSGQKKPQLTPQVEERIEEVAFKPIDFILEQPQNTYRNIIELIQDSFKKIIK